MKLSQNFQNLKKILSTGPDGKIYVVFYNIKEEKPYWLPVMDVEFRTERTFSLKYIPTNTTESLKLRVNEGMDEDERKWCTNPLGFGTIVYCCSCGDKLTKLNCHEYVDSGRGPLSYHYVSKPEDYDGYRWRSFCDNCWKDVEDMRADEICSTFEPSEYRDGDSDKELFDF